MSPSADSAAAEVPQLPRWLRRSSVAWACAGLAALAIVLTIGFLLHEKQALEAGEQQSAELYARVLQDHAERTFNTIDLAMNSLAAAVGTPMDATDAERLGQDALRAQQGLSFLRSLSLIDGSGRVLASSSPANIGAAVDLRAIPLPAPGAFDALGDSVNGRDLADASALAPSAPGGLRTFVPLVRAIAQGAGARLFIVAAINPDFFANDHELMLADATRGAAILSTQGRVIASTSNIRKLPGERLSGNRFFTHYLPARESGSFIGAGIDGSRVITAFRVLRQRPIAIVVERGYAPVLAGFHLTVVWMLGLCAVVVVVLGSLTALAWRSLRSRETVLNALEATRRGIASSERDLRVLVESVHELIFRADASGRISFVNGRWQELTSRPAADVLGKRVTDLCREDERQACRDMFKRLELQDETILIHVLDGVGRSLTLDLTVSRVSGADGRIAGYAGFAVDVSAREAAQQALQSQLKFTAQLIELSPTPVFVKDEAGRFVTVNRAWLELMNLESADVLGRDSTDLFGADAAMHQQQDARLMQAEGRICYENRHHAKGRSPRDTVVTKVRFTRADGTPAGIVGSIVDVTEFRQAERDIRKARDAAETANKAKSEFIANISHELRTPLQGIMGFSELGAELARDLPSFVDLFNDIQAGGQRMLKLVNGLLDVSQMDSAVGSLPLERVDIAPLVKDAVAQLVGDAETRRVQVTQHGLDEPVHCHVDPPRFQQAVRHVLANAIRYSPIGGRVEIGLAGSSRSTALLSVRDFGPGIPESELELIFDAFVQSSRTRDGSGGTGLGLTIARKIMSAHGGSVVAANAPGGGAVVRLALPGAEALERPQHGRSTEPGREARRAAEVH